MSDEQYRRYVHINLPHARTIAQRIARELDLLGAFREDENGGAVELHAAVTALEQALRPFDDDPACEPAVAAADAIAEHARTLVTAVLATTLAEWWVAPVIRDISPKKLPESRVMISLSEMPGLLRRTWTLPSARR